MKLKIENLAFKEGVSQKTGKAYKRVGVFSGGKWYNTFAAAWNQGWQIGDEIDVEIEESVYNGKPQYNIKKPDPMRGLAEKIDNILLYVQTISATLNDMRKNSGGSGSNEPPDFNEEGPPF